MSIKDKSVRIEKEEIYNITKLAESIHEYIFSDSDNYEMLERYLEAISIEVYYAEFEGLDGLDGYLKINEDTGLPRIVVKANQYKPRQRFTMAYELGSLVINHKFIPGQDIEGWKKEHGFKNGQILDIKAANARKSIDELRLYKFAAAFLMPTKKILNLTKIYYGQNHRKIKSSELVHLIRNTFFVSKEAAILRLKEIDLL